MTLDRYKTKHTLFTEAKAKATPHVPPTHHRRQQLHQSLLSKVLASSDLPIIRGSVLYPSEGVRAILLI